MTKAIRLDLAGDGPTHCYYAREELLDKRVIAIDYQTGTIPKWITEQGEYLGDTPTETSAISFWRLPTELLAVQAHLSVQSADKNQVI
jgi:hypothetical protein